MIVKRYYILYFIFLVMIIKISPLDEYIKQGRYNTHDLSNYFITFTVLAYALLFLCKRIQINKIAFKIIAVIFCIFLLNFIFALDRNPSWFLYQCIFLATALYTASIYSHLSAADYEIICTHFKKICDLWLIIVSGVCIYLMTHYFYIIKLFFRREDIFNNYIRRLYYDFWWDKHMIGATCGILICYILTYPKQKLRNTLLLIPILPVISGIRNLLLGFTLSAILIKIRKTRTILLVALVSLLLIFIFRDDVFKILKKDVRVTGLINITDIMKKYPFGVGNGRYATYVNNVINTHIDYWHVGYKYTNDSAESDIVYVFGSLGLISGLVFYVTLMVILYRLWRIYPNLSPYPDKFFALVFIYFIFSGIGEDWMFSFVYWILFGFALGVATAKRNEFNGKSISLSKISSRGGQQPPLVNHI